MPLLTELQGAFAAALLAPSAPPPDGVVGPDGGPAPRRFAVYRNNVAAALANTVALAFPAVSRIVGEAFFRAMALAYVRAEPPRSAMLLDYGATFPDFVAGFPPAASLPYLSDVARIEWAWREAYNACDAAPLDPAALGAVPEAEIGGLRFVLHPASRLVRSRFPALTIWRMNVSDAQTEAVDFSVAEDALIVRPGAEVEVRLVPPGGAAFLAALGEGRTLMDAAATAQAADGRFDLAGNLVGLLGAGALALATPFALLVLRLERPT